MCDCVLFGCCLHVGMRFYRVVPGQLVHVWVFECVACEYMVVTGGERAVVDKNASHLDTLPAGA